MVAVGRVVLLGEGDGLARDGEIEAVVRGPGEGVLVPEGVGVRVGVFEGVKVGVGV